MNAPPKARCGVIRALLQALGEGTKRTKVVNSIGCALKIKQEGKRKRESAGRAAEAVYLTIPARGLTCNIVQLSLVPKNSG